MTKWLQRCFGSSINIFFVKRNCLYLQRPMPQWTCIPILGATNLMPACVSVLSGLNSSSCLGSFVDCLQSLHHTGKHPGLKGHSFLLTTSPNREVNKKKTETLQKLSNVCVEVISWRCYISYSVPCQYQDVSDWWCCSWCGKNGNK